MAAEPLPDDIWAVGDWADPAAVVTACDQCGRTRPCVLSSDPFKEEVCDEVTPRGWWCRPCHYQACEDI